MKNFISKVVFMGVCVLILASLNACRSGSNKENQKDNTLPNIVLIMADDMGYECLSCNGSLSYSTPAIDNLANTGIRFTHCISQPLCTPSRVKIMTGKYNFRNYEYFGYLNPNQETFGNMMKKAGYKTCIAGKWQLNGLYHNLDECKDNNRPNHFGFDEYCLWQLTQKANKGERYSNPYIEQNGKALKLTKDDYGPDVFCNYVTDFIKRNKENPFFVYYPMVLVHDPFVPTPDSKEWAEKNNRYKRDNAYFKDMIGYADKIVGTINSTLKELNIDNNTLVIFTGDNGTHRSITSQTISGSVTGFKGNTTDAGTHVPLVAKWPDKIKSPAVYDGLIDFSDFYPTFAHIAGNNKTYDGKSFFEILTGKKNKEKESIMIHYDPRWGKNVNLYRNRFSRTKKFKLYQDGEFFNLLVDPLEKSPIPLEELSPEILKIRKQLQQELNKAPVWEKTDN